MILKRTSFSNNAKATIHYLYCGVSNTFNKPKHDNPAKVRNLVIDGIGVDTANPNLAFNDMNYFIKQNQKSRRELLDLILAFNVNEFPPNAFNHDNSSWAIRLDQIAKQFAFNAFGSNHQALLCVQNDTRNQQDVHVHIAVNMININNFKSITGSLYNLTRLKRIAKDTVRSFNKSNGTHLSTGIPNKLTSSQRHELNIIRPLVSNDKITSLSNFSKALRHHHIRVNIHRKGDNLRNGIKFKRPGMSFDWFPNGNIKSGYSYHVKASTLATKGNCPVLTYSNLSKQFRLNQYHQQHLINTCDKILRSKSNLKSLSFVINHSPAESQIKQAHHQISKITALKRARIINNQGLGL